MTASPLPDLRTYLADVRVRRSLANLVRARVPARDAEDVVQSVLCAALAADVVPVETSHLPRWIAGIARHKVADAHRRARREPPTDDIDVEAPAPEFEVRQIAQRVVREAAEDAAACKTLEWIAREHEGETWAAIARAEGLPGAVVRKRISRFRRAVRARWLGALSLLLLAGLSATASRAVREDTIVADVARPAVALRGEWRVDRIELDTNAGPEQTMATLEAVGARVRVDDGRVRWTSPMRTATYTMVSLEADGANDVVVLRDEAGRPHRVSVSRAGDLQIRVDEGKWHAVITLRRE